MLFRSLNGANTNAQLDANGNMTVTGTVCGASSNMFRNRIINGDMRIDQRYSGTANTIALSTVSYVIDRWIGQNYTGTGTFTVQQMNSANSSVSNYESGSAPSGFINSMKLTVGTANTNPSSTNSSGLGQAIEGLNVLDLGWGTASAKTVTLSFWAKSSITGQFAAVLYNVDGTRIYNSSITVTSTNTWQYYSITVPGDTSGTWLTNNNTGIWFKIYLSLGSSYLTSSSAWNSSSYYGLTGQTNWMGNSGNTFYITGVQLEAGTVATPFEFRHYGAELALCQRYYYQTVPSTGHFMTVHYNGSGRVRGAFSIPVPMRAAPTLSFTGSLSFYVYNGSAISSTGSLAASGLGAGNVSGYVDINVSSVTASDQYDLLATLQVSAEL